MTDQEIKVLETAVVLIIYIIVYFVTKVIINNSLKNTQLQRARRKITIKAIHLFTSITALILLAAIWGLKQDEITVFASSVLTVLGIAFVAQWSLLSNITSSIILFFNHPLNIGDSIKILDKDYLIEGEISDLTYFYVHLVTPEGELMTIPNTVFLQSAVSVIVKK